LCSPPSLAITFVSAIPAARETEVGADLPAGAFDGVEVPPGGVLILRNGTMYGGGPYSYFTGSYSAQNGFLRGELVVNQHTAPPSDHLLFSAGEVGMGISGSYEGDQAKLTGTVVIGKRCVTLQIALRKLADI
jgi:hypothetical protein